MNEYALPARVSLAHRSCSDAIFTYYVSLTADFLNTAVRQTSYAVRCALQAALPSYITLGHGSEFLLARSSCGLGNPRARQRINESFFVVQLPYLRCERGVYQWRMRLQHVLFRLWNVVYLYAPPSNQIVANVALLDSACEGTSMSNARFPLSQSGTLVTGECEGGYRGSPKAVCNNGVWGAVSDPCTSAHTT